MDELHVKSCCSIRQSLSPLQQRAAVVALVIFSLLFCSMPMGCGKKGDPLPPEHLMPQPPLKLAHELKGDALLLTWHNQEADNKGGGIEIFRAVKSGLPEEECRTCPLDFELIASLPPSASQYQQSIDKGFVYFYKVRCYTENTLYSDYSKKIEFEY